MARKHHCERKPAEKPHETAVSADRTVVVSTLMWNDVTWRNRPGHPAQRVAWPVLLRLRWCLVLAKQAPRPNPEVTRTRQHD